MSESLVQILNDVQQRIETIEDDIYRNALMYQYLIGGNASEVSGECAPERSDMYEVKYNINGRIIPAIMFIVKPIKTNNYYRACVLPLEHEYEPWTEQVRDWFLQFQDGYPFRFSERATWETNKTYLMKKATKVFDGLKWLKESYTTQKKRQIRREVTFTSTQLRDLRHDVLKELYGFDVVDLAYFGAWNDPVVNMQMKLQKEQVFESSPKRDEITKFEKIGQTYIEKLLIRHNELQRIQRIPRGLVYRDNVELTNRLDRSSHIISLIRDINTVFEMKRNAPLLSESMGLVLDILYDCEYEDTLQSNITEAMTIFEINLDTLKSLVSDPNDKKSITLLRDFLDENSISYDKNMFETWIHMGLLRNYFDHKRDTEKLKAVLTFFDEPQRMPLNSGRLWEKILDNFEDSLNELLRIVNSL